MITKVRDVMYLLGHQKHFDKYHPLTCAHHTPTPTHFRIKSKALKTILTDFVRKQALSSVHFLHTLALSLPSTLHSTSHTQHNNFS